MPFNSMLMKLTSKMLLLQQKKTPVPTGVKHTEIEIKGYEGLRLIVDVFEPENMETAEFDCLHDEGIDYAEKLKQHGVEVALFETKGTIHVFENAMEREITQGCIK